MMMHSRPPGGVPSAHADRFARRLLPPPALWPQFDYAAAHLCDYPDRLNAAAALIDAAVAAGAGAKAAYHFGDLSWTYAHLLDRAERIARVLAEDLGLVPGNRVLLRSANSPMLVACWLAVLKAGGICVTTMPMLRARELAYIIDKAEISHALCDIDLAEEMETARRQTAMARIAYFSATGDAANRDADLDRAAAAKPAGFATVPTAADDIALITFTSGTTGYPKAAAHFHRDILAAADSLPLVYRVASDEVVCGSAPMAFTYGLAAQVLYPLRFRATAALVARPAPENILAAVARHRVTSLYGVPTGYHHMLAQIGRFDLRSLRRCASAGEHLRGALWQAWREATGVGIVNGLGMTELLSHCLSESEPVEHPGSTGRAVPGYTVCLLDDDGVPLPRGRRGRLAVRGPTGCRYLDDPERQAAFVRNGWNVTGDIMEQDEAGRFWYVDRSDDIIVSAGYNISAQEVERALSEHPDVAECAVVGVPDPVRGAILRACVVLREPRDNEAETADELGAFVRSLIATYKCPREFRFIEALPRTATGKVQRFRLRQS